MARNKDKEPEGPEVLTVRTHEEELLLLTVRLHDEWPFGGYDPGDFLNGDDQNVRVQPSPGAVQ